MRELIDKIKKKGFFHIFGSSVINKIIQFCSGIFLVRLLSKSEFGSYSYAQNIMYIFLLFNGLGVLFALLQYGSEDTKKKNYYYKYALRIGLLFNVFLSVSIVIYTVFIDFPNTQSKIALLLMAFMPFNIFLFEYIQNYLRTSLLNVEFSRISTINTFFIFSFSVLGAVFFGVFGVIIANYLAYFGSIIFGFITIKKRIAMQSLTNEYISKVEKKGFMEYSIVSMLNNVISQVVYFIDIFLIGIMIKNTSVIAVYKTATLIPFALNFIPISAMTFIYPYFAKNRENKHWVNQNLKKIQRIMFIINFCIVTFLIIFAPLIINILFGKNYSESIVLFRILCFGYLIAGTFRIPAGNILSMLREVKFLFIANIIIGILNILLDLILISKYSALGAAISTVSTILISSIIYNIYLNMKVSR